MKQLLRKLIRGVAYFGAAIVIVLAIAVGIFRLMLPRLPEYQEEIKGWASSAIGMEVEFSGMNARWRFSGPELSFFDAGLNQEGTGISILTADEVSIGVGLLRLVRDRELVVDRVSIRGSTIDLRQDGNGDWILQGITVAELTGNRDMPSQSGGNIVLVGENLNVEYEHPASGQLVPFTVSSVTVSRNENELGIEAEIDLAEEFGRRLEVSASKRLEAPDDDLWRIYVEGDSLDLAGWSRLQQFALPEINSGTADFALWFDVVDRAVESANANFVVAGLHAAGPEIVAPVDIRGSFEFSADGEGWLLAANQMRLTTVDGDWPDSSLQLRILNDQDGSIEGVRASASYLNLNDLKYLKAWLPEERQVTLDEFAPSGTLRDVSIELADMQADMPDFDVSADLSEAGFAAIGERPGIRKFSGRVRADRDGGRVEIGSTNLTLDLGSHLSEPLLFDEASGTIIWRRGPDGITVLSDSVRIRNADLDSQMSLQVSMPGSGAAPVIDFNSQWSVFDVRSVERYLPIRLITPKLHDWLSNALESGYVRRGTARFNGALDDFPFDNGEGLFRIEARLEDAIFNYAPTWPSPQFHHLDLVLENTRLYSVENLAFDVDNLVDDARIEIPDLREPILSVEAFATGSLESIRSYAQSSPIANFLGNKLDLVEVDGDASFDLSLTIPIQQIEDYEFMTRIRSNDGMVRVRGFAAPITELNGTITITRTELTSDSLFARFLGHPVDLTLTRVPDVLAGHSVILEGNGKTTAGALEAEFGIQLNGVVEGDTNYHASVRFPNARSPQPAPLQIAIESDLYGIQVNLPAPIGKSDEVALQMSANIEFPTENQIVTAGSLAGDINWMARFLKQDNAWDFDRGVLAVGEYPRAADVRGFHIHGQLPALYVHDWLAEGRRGRGGGGIGERIRSIDLNVERLYVVGQQFSDHRVEVNRSGRDWLIKLSGADAEGRISVPYDFTAGRGMTLEMDRLILPGDEAPRDNQVPLDPRSLPALSIVAEEFALGERYFGKLEAEFERTDRGLEAGTLKTTDDSFSVSGSAGWIIDADAESGQRTFIDATLTSTNIQQTAQRLAYDPGIIGDSMQVDLELGWPGSPRRDFMAALSGTVGVNIGAGSLDELDPGAGRVFGLLSFTALPRRLSLDFSDVFDKGFGFDQIAGNFRLLNGDAFTCNLTLTGPAADVGIIGRAGLEKRDYDQAAVVSANVGGTLPIAGFFLGGPQVAAALLVFTQVFKNPLKGVGQVFYSVKGSWDEPAIEPTDSQDFAATSSRAGCIDN
jgi:uncharacterized protein (TIGR02099 family)